MLPLAYVLRNVRRRRLRTGLTIAGIALVVAVYFLMGSVAETMVKSFRSTGGPEELVIVQAGAMLVDYSNIDRWWHPSSFCPASSWSMAASGKRGFAG